MDERADGLGVADRIHLHEAWETRPDESSKIVVLATNSGVAEASFHRHTAGLFVAEDQLHGPPGTISSLRSGDGRTMAARWQADFAEWRTIAHELGHNLGLLHGGTDFEAHKPAADYQSLMSYTHQAKLDPTTPANSYAGVGADSGN